MRVEFQGKNMQVSDRLKERVTEKLGKFDKYFQSDVVATVNFSQIRSQQTCEITISLKHDVHLRAEETTHDMFTSIDRAVEKLERQIRKHRTALRKRYITGDSIRYFDIPEDDDYHEEEQEHEIEIVRTKNFPIKPMDAVEAIMQMRLLGHNFFVFLNGETEQVNVVYQRKNGGYGLIEPTI